MWVWKTDGHFQIVNKFRTEEAAGVICILMLTESFRKHKRIFNSGSDLEAGIQMRIFPRGFPAIRSVGHSKSLSHNSRGASGPPSSNTSVSPKLKNGENSFHHR